MRSTLCAAMPGLALSAIVTAQPTTEIRFENGTNAIAVEPGATVHVGVYAGGFPDLWSYIPWRTMNVPYLVRYCGFTGAFFDMHASGGGTWSNPAIAPGMGYMNDPPFGSPGTPTGQSVTGINIQTGWHPPVQLPEFPLWTGDITVGHGNVTLRSELQPMNWYTPAQTGFEIAIDWGGTLWAPDVLPAFDAVGYITVPAPGAGVALGVGVVLAVRRRRSTPAPCSTR